MKYDILLIGGNGFVGHVLAARLQEAGYSVLLPTRHLASARDLRVLPAVHIEEADVRDFDELQNLCSRIHAHGAVINLVGVLHDKPASPYGSIFREAHVRLPGNIVTAMQLHGLKRYLQMSALGADVNGRSMYQRSKGDGEQIVKDSDLDWTIFRPSVIFGERDQFINLFANLAKRMPVIPLAHADARFQPVNVDDVAAAFVKSLRLPQTIGQSYDLVGPIQLTLKEIVQLAAHQAQSTCAVVPVPGWIGYMQALAFEFLPIPTLMSRDNIASMKVPNVLPLGSKNALTEVFGISPRRIEGTH